MQELNVHSPHEAALRSEVEARHFKPGGLNIDVLNGGILFNVQAAWAYKEDSGQNFLDMLKPVATYADYFRANRKPEEADAVLSKSKPEAVVAYDTLVRDFNSRLDSIRKGHDLGAVEDLFKRAKALIWGEEI